MSQELFEKYLLNTLTDDEKRRLSELLSREEVARDFVEYVQEWTLLADLSRQRAAIKVVPARRDPRAHWGWAAAGLAAAVLVVVGILFSGPQAPVDPPGSAQAPTARPAPAPVAEPAKDLPVPDPAPVPPPPVADRPPAPLPEKAPEPPKPVPPPPAPPHRAVAVQPEPKGPEKPVGPTIPSLAELEEVRGEVFVLTLEKRIPAKPGLAVLADQGLVVAGRDAQASVRFPDGTRLELGSGAMVERFTDRQGRRVFLVQGSLRAAVAKQVPGRAMVVATPHSETAVLGTEFTVSVLPEATRLEVWEGRVRFTRLPERDSIEVGSGSAAVAGKGQPFKAEPMVFTRHYQDGVSPDRAYAGTRDTQISQVDPSQNLGAAAVLEADGDETGGKSLVALLKWDLSSIPPSSVIRSVELTLYIDGTAKGLSYEIHAVRRPWGETEATWTRPWAKPGAKDRSDRGADLVGAIAPREHGHYTLIFTDAGVALVQAWVRDPRVNHGVLIANDLNSDGFKFASREAAKLERRPRLSVTYSLGSK